MIMTDSWGTVRPLVSKVVTEEMCRIMAIYGHVVFIEFCRDKLIINGKIVSFCTLIANTTIVIGETNWHCFSLRHNACKHIWLIISAFISNDLLTGIYRYVLDKRKIWIYENRF